MGKKLATLFRRLLEAPGRECPGEEACIRRQIEPTGCEDCPLTGDEDEALMSALGGWALHIMAIRQMMHAGCLFGPDDLTEAEWRALALLERVVAEVVEKRIESRG